MRRQRTLTRADEGAGNTDVILMGRDATVGDALKLLLEKEMRCLHVVGEREKSRACHSEEYTILESSLDLVLSPTSLVYQLGREGNTLRQLLGHGAPSELLRLEHSMFFGTTAVLKLRVTISTIVYMREYSDNKRTIAY